MLKPTQPVSLATFRELRSHLQQIPGVQVNLCPAPQATFDYMDSQVEGLEIEYGQVLATREQEQLQAILRAYGFSGSL